MIDLDRFALYDYLRMPPPKSTKAEQLMNAKLGELIGHSPDVDLSYDYSYAPQSSDERS